MALNQLRAHLVGKEGMFEIRAVMDARRQNSDDGITFTRGRRNAAERLPQVFWVIADVADANSAEQFGKHIHHRFAVFEHIGHARWRPGIILQHKKFIRPCTHQINPDDVGIDPARRQKTYHLG